MTHIKEILPEALKSMLSQQNKEWIKKHQRFFKELNYNGKPTASNKSRDNKTS